MLATRETALRGVRAITGSTALMYPRRAALGAALVLALGAVVWMLLAHPWNTSLALPYPTSGFSTTELAPLLSRSGYGPGGSDVRVLWATPEYFQATGQLGLATHYDVEKNLVLFVWENIHDGDLPERLRPTLRVDGFATYEPAQVIVPANAVHHRFSVLIFPRTDAEGRSVLSEETRSLELVLPPANDEGAQSVLYWSLPFAYPPAVSRGTFSLTWASVLALLGGVFASMWPCLFQLTAYFIPTLAGVSMSRAHERETSALVRLRVLRTAAFFVLGFAIVYTAAGAAAGWAAQSLDGTSLFWSWRRPVSIAAGLVILYMALRLAANARAPLVCKMPIGNFLGKKSPGYLGTMLLGLAFAAGCTTCFGAAVILGIVTYVGIAGTPFYGALIMLLFSLGMAVPLVLGAAAMARVLSLLGRLEKVAPYLVIGSSAVMAGFAALLLSGRYMALSNWALRNFPPG